MTEPSGRGPAPVGRQEAERQARLVREADALRDNLYRRKQQARARADAATAPAGPQPAGKGSGNGDCPSG